MEGNLHRYQAFVQVAELGSFTRAAEALSYSQSAVSRLVADLEREWDVTLLERSRAGVALTREGEQLLPAARALCAAHDEFRTRVDSLHNLSAGIIRIGAFSSVSTHWLPRIIAAFRRDYPGMEYELFLGDYDEMENALITGRIDCAFLRLPTEANGLAATPLTQDELLAVLPEGHPLAALNRVPIEQLAREPFIMLEKGHNEVVAEAFERAGVQPNTQVTTWDDFTIMAMVEAGMGVSILPELILRRTPYRLVTRPLVQPAYREIGFVTRKCAVLPLAVQRFAEYLGYREK